MKIEEVRNYTHSYSTKNVVVLGIEVETLAVIFSYRGYFAEGVEVFTEFLPYNVGIFDMKVSYVVDYSIKHNLLRVIESSDFIREAEEKALRRVFGRIIFKCDNEA
ncbi:MAG: hypothetical protein QXL94_05640 [Candidatus Parvarchaeum sp.]